MKRFVEGADRDQPTLFPECLEDWIDENNPVRVIDVFVDNLDLTDLDFAGVDPQSIGRPSYHPAVLLKIYSYGYLNAVQSSCRLEREANRNVEVMWMTRRLAPDHKTIADFRKDNGSAIRKVCARFVELCRRERCSGLPVIRYDPTGLAEILGPGFVPVSSVRHPHRTPWDAPQSFQFSVFRRSPEAW